MKKMFSIILAPPFFLLLSGCMESYFNLDDSSRLPKWITLPDKLSRHDVEVVMTYYIYPNERKAIFKITEKNCYFFCSSEITGKVHGLSPILIEVEGKNDSNRYPAYEIVEVEGVMEVIEHKKMEPVFYIVDDPIILEKLSIK